MRQILIIAQNTIKALIRKKDFYVFLMVLIMLMFFLNLQNFYDIQDISRFIKELGFSCLWISSLILAVIFTAKQLPEEIKSKTIYPLLSKPVTRLHIVLGRYLGSLFALTIAFSTFYFFYILMSLIKGEGIGFVLIVQQYILGILFLGLVCAIALFFSLIMTYAAAVVSSFILYFSIILLADSLRTLMLHIQPPFNWGTHILYYLIPHYEFYNISGRMIHGWQALPFWAFFAIVVYTIIYVYIMLYFCYLIIRKKIL